MSGPETPSEADDLLRVGQLTAPLGVAGALKLFVIGDVGQLLRATRLFVEGTGWLRVRALERHGPGAAVRFVGVEGREAADLLRGRAVFARGSELPALPEGEYYYHDLIGLPVRSPAGEEIGRVRDVMDAGHQDLLVVDLSVERGGVSALVPLQAPYVEVLSGEAVVVDAPPGLLEG